MTPIHPRLLIFDFDGVLAATEDLHFAAYEALLGSLGLAIRRQDYYERYLGLPDEETIAAAFATAGRRVGEGEMPALLARKRREYALRSTEARLYPGVAATLRRLERRYLLAIASGAFRDEITGVLDRDSVRELFHVIV